MVLLIHIGSFRLMMFLRWIPNRRVLNHSSAILVQQPKIQQDGGSMSCKKPFT
ncbi:hypothetical protein ABKV19_016304, partial [Rosa sericea]